MKRVPRGRVYRRGKTWSYTIDTPAGAEGKRQQRKRGGFRTQTDAQAALDELRSQLYGGTFSQPHELTVDRYLDEVWLPAKRLQVRATTAHSYDSHLRRIRGLLGLVALQDLTPLHIDRAYRAMATDGLSPRTIRYTHGLLLQALAYAQRKGLVSRNVAALADPPPAKTATAARRPAVWTAEQCRTFLASVADDRLATLWLLFLATGARRGELLALRWSDVDAPSGALSITKARTTTGYQVSEDTPKTHAGIRSVSVDVATVAALRDHRRRQAGEQLAAGAAWRGADHVFVDEIGRALHPDWVSKRFRELADATQLPRIRLHDLRHSSATLLLEAGLSPRVVADRLGHADPAVLLRVYAHTLAEADKRAAVALGDALTGPLKPFRDHP